MTRRPNRIAAPVVTDRQNRRIARAEDFPVAPADLRALLAHPDHSLGPVEKRIRIATLRRCVDAFEAVDTKVPETGREIRFRNFIQPEIGQIDPPLLSWMRKQASRCGQQV